MLPCMQPFDPLFEPRSVVTTPQRRRPPINNHPSATCRIAACLRAVLGDSACFWCSWLPLANNDRFVLPLPLHVMLWSSPPEGDAHTQSLRASLSGRVPALCRHFVNSSLLDTYTHAHALPLSCLYRHLRRYRVECKELTRCAPVSLALHLSLTHSRSNCPCSPEAAMARQWTAT